jgi:hypothetical protein
MDAKMMFLNGDL